MIRPASQALLRGNRSSLVAQGLAIHRPLIDSPFGVTRELPSILKELLQTAGLLGSTNITPLPQKLLLLAPKTATKIDTAVTVHVARRWPVRCLGRNRQTLFHRRGAPVVAIAASIGMGG
jgi:hypothetical protein